MKRRKLLRIIFLALFFLGVIQLLPSIVRYVEHEQESKYLAGLFRESEAAGQSAVQDQTTGQTAAVQEGTDEQKLDVSASMLAKFQALYQQNSDIIGWLSIDGTKIDYPVMQNEDDEFYLHHGFQKEGYDKYGCLFVRNNADVFTPGTNFIIYGHNMRDGSMFGELDNYKKESFYKEHALIYFDTLYEERTYEIVSVFLSQVYGDQEEVFKYYEFYQADTEEEFADFYQNIKALSLYDTGVQAEYGDTFLTLSTCAYHVENGRMVVVAKKSEAH